VIDSMLETTPISGAPDYTFCTKKDDCSLIKQEVFIKHISEQKKNELGEPDGRWIGMMKVNQIGRQWLHEAIEHLKAGDDFDSLSMPGLLNFLVKQGRKIHVHYINGHWLDVNSLDDIARASDFTHGQ